GNGSGSPGSGNGNGSPGALNGSGNGNNIPINIGPITFFPNGLLPGLELPKGFKFPKLPNFPKLPKLPFPNPFPNGKPKDPNALTGPAGFGAQNFIQPTASLGYTIEFENDGSLAALDVTVNEQLDSNLDWPTFQLGSFGFGSVHVAVPAGLTQYQTTLSY